MVIRATKIRMKPNQQQSNELTEIDSIYLTGVTEENFYKKEDIHDFLIENENIEIEVNIAPYPNLIAVTNATQKYVRSSPNGTPNDNLLKLPRD